MTDDNEYVVTSIKITKKHMEYCDAHAINLSARVRIMLDQDMERADA